jgi:hypothetical protein
MFMVRRLSLVGFVLAAICLAAGAPSALAGNISGDYLEIRSCAVYTGPCFANAEMGVTGREALLAWKIDTGKHNGVDLSGLKAVMAVSAGETLGHADRLEHAVKAVIMADEKANREQREALVDFVKTRAGKLAESVQKVEFVAIELKVDQVDMAANLKAGRNVDIRTRKLVQGDCVCTNEIVYYPPLTKVDNYAPAFTLEGRYSGRGLGVTWSQPNTRSAFLATFDY